MNVADPGNMDVVSGKRNGKPQKRERNGDKPEDRHAQRDGQIVPLMLSLSRYRNDG